MNFSELIDQFFNKRSYVAGKFALELDGNRAGWLHSFEGGMPTAELVNERTGPDPLTHKHISGVKYEDLTVSFGTGMSKEFVDWITNSFQRKYSRANGAVISADYNQREKGRLSFYNALVSQATFPALDANSKEPSKMTVKITPEYSRFEFSKTPGPPIKGEYNRQIQSRWNPDNFRLRIGHLDCTRVSKIDALTLTQKTTTYNIGEVRDYQVEPVQIEYPNLVITLPESHSDSWWKWYKDFVVDGNCNENSEVDGVLEFLDTSHQKTLLTVGFSRLGIFKATPDKAEAGSDSIRKVKFEMYCEGMDFKFGSGSVWK